LSYDPLQKFFDIADPTKDLSNAELDALFPTESLLERLKGEVNNEPVGWFRKRLWRRTIIVSTTAVLVLAGTAAAFTFLRSPVQDVTRLSCFESVSLSSGAEVVAYSGQPLAMCRSVMHWLPVPGSPVPNGSLCVLTNGSLAGFPPSRRAQACTQLGLPVFNGRLKNPEVAAFEQAAQNYFSENSCMDPAAARNGVLQLIGRFAISGWHVRVSGSKSEVACATLGIQGKVRVVDIVEIINRSTP
jgi:hypothetical protein